MFYKALLWYTKILILLEISPSKIFFLILSQCTSDEDASLAATVNLAAGFSWIFFALQSTCLFDCKDKEEKEATIFMGRNWLREK